MNPLMLSAQSACERLEAFGGILDARSPEEFEEDHLPGAQSCPVLTNEERARVGTQHQQDPFLARRLGAGLVAANIAQHLEGSLAQHDRDWEPLVYCWRGGQRSQALATVLARVGWRVSLLEGGYKAFRSHVLEQIPLRSRALQFRVVCGVTGSGKTQFLGALRALGHQVLDLEALAAHRGSLLGALPNEPQPSQRQFETRIWHALTRLNPQLPVFVESESKKVGNVQVPDELMNQIRTSPCITLELAMSDRIRLLCAEYAHFFEHPEALKQQLEKLMPLVGQTQTQRWAEQVDQQDWPGLVHSLLALHYDPSYLRSIDRNFPQRAEGPIIRVDGPTAADYEAAALSLSL